jgi:hypothetical protein
MLIKTIALSAVLAAFASGASALCPNPSAIGPNDTVVQFSNRSASGSLGAMGAKAALNPRLPGTVFYDHVAQALQLCDGTDWVTIQDSGASSTPEDGRWAEWGIWKKTTDAFPPAYGSGPLNRYGTYTVNIELGPSSTACRAQFRNDVMLSKLADAGSGDTAAHATYTFYGKGNGTYSYSLESKGGSRNAQNEPEYSTPAPNGLFMWNGFVHIDCPWSNVTIMRVK